MKKRDTGIVSMSVRSIILFIAAGLCAAGGVVLFFRGNITCGIYCLGFAAGFVFWGAGTTKKPATVQTSGKKIAYLEILRVIAIWGVLFCHTGNEGVHHYLVTDNAVNYWFGILLASVSQYCIPLFFMITGALLLKREESISYVFRHRIFKMILITYLVVLLQCLWNNKINPLIGFNMKIYFASVFEGSATTPHWFLYQYISLLLVLPFLQRLVKVIPDKGWFLYLFLADQVINGFFPILAYYQDWGDSLLELPMFPEVIISCLIGYYVENCSEEIFYKKRNVAALIVVSLLLMAETMHVNHLSIPEKQIAAFGGTFATVYALTLFVIVRYICHRWKMPAVIEKVFYFAGAGVFGTYLIEGQLRHIFHPIYVVLNTRIHSYPAVFVWISVSVLAGILVSNLFKRILRLGMTFAQKSVDGKISENGFP